MKRKLTAVLLTLCMVLGMLPMTALAAETDPAFAIVNSTEQFAGKAYNSLYTGSVALEKDASAANTWNIVPGTDGKLTKITTEWTEFHGTNADEQTGFYVPISIPKTVGDQEISKMVLNGTKADGTAEEKTYTGDALTAAFSDNSNSACYVVFHLGKTAEAAQAKSVTVKLTYGSGAETTYTFKAAEGLFETTAPVTFTVTFDVNAPSGVTENLPQAPDAVEFESEGTLTTIPTLTLAGYTFIGWATTADATEADVTESTTFSENTTLYAVWAEETAPETDAEKVAAAKTAIEALLTEDAVKAAVTADGVTDTDTAKTAIEALITDEAKGEVTATVTVSEFTAPTETADGSVKYSVALTLNSETGEIAEATVTLPMTGSGDTHTHNFTQVAEKAATCTEAGMQAHQTCDGPDCEGKFFDADGNEVTEASLTIPAKGHTFVDGVCTVCGAADPDYKPAHQHTFVKVSGTPATCGAPGTKDYYHCTAAGCDVANKMYADAQGKTEITDLVIPATGKHTFADGKCSVCGAVDPDYTAPAPVVPGDVSDTDKIDPYKYDDAATGKIVVAPKPTDTGVKVETKPVEIKVSDVKQGEGVKIDVTKQIEENPSVKAEEVTEVAAEVKAADVKALAQQESPILVATPVADVAVPAAALKEAAAQAQTGVTIVVSKDTKKEVTSGAKIKVEILVDGKPLAVAKLAAPIQVSIPVAAEDEGKTVQVFHINGSRRGLVRGTLGKIVKGVLNFSTRHLSEFSYTTDETEILDVNVLTEALNGGNKSYTYYVLPTDYVVDFVKDGNTAVFHVSTGSSVYETISGGKVNAWVLTKPLTVNADGTVSYEKASLVADSQNIQ